MKTGDTVIYSEDNIERLCEIWRIRTFEEDNIEYTTYDILYPERNVPLELIQNNKNTKLEKGDIVIYKNYEAYVSKIDWNSSSAQLRIIQRNLYYNN